MKWRIQIYECCNSGRNIHVDQIPRRVCSIWSLTFSTPLADFQPWRQMSATALQALQAPGTEGIHTQSKNMWIFHNFPAVVSEAVRTCPRLLHNHIHQNHRKSVWLVGLPMGLNVGKGHNQPIYQKSNAWIIFLAIYLSICHVTSEISFSSTAISAGAKDTEADGSWSSAGPFRSPTCPAMCFGERAEGNTHKQTQSQTQKRTETLASPAMYSSISGSVVVFHSAIYHCPQRMVLQHHLKTALYTKSCSIHAR